MNATNDRSRLWRAGALRVVLVLGVVAALLHAIAPASASAAIVTDLVSKSTQGVVGNADSVSCDVSDDGRYVVFESAATLLVLGAADTNGASDVFIRDNVLRTTTLVSSPDGGLNAGNAGSYTPAISGNGSKVAFVSDATDLKVGTPSGARGVYVWDVQTHVLTRVDVAADALGTPSNGRAGKYVAIDFDGSRVAFISSASNLDPTVPNNRPGVFVRDLALNTTRLVSVSSDGLHGGNGSSMAPSISADGQRVAFASDATNLVTGDTNLKRDVFVRSIASNTTKRISYGAAGETDGSSDWPAISPDGRWVAFESLASDLLAVPVDQQQVYVGSVDTTAVTCVSVTPAGLSGNGAAAAPGISADGRYVSFESEATDIAAGPFGPAGGVFVRDRTAKTILRINPGVYPGAPLASYTALSADGRYVVFESSLASLGTQAGVRNVYRADLRPPVPAYLPAPSLSTNYPARYHDFYVSGKISGHTAATTVRLYVYYKADHTLVYKLNRTITVKIAARATSYKVKVRFSSVGNYYVTARHFADAQHLDTTSPKSRGFRVH